MLRCSQPVRWPFRGQSGGRLYWRVLGGPVPTDMRITMNRNLGFLAEDLRVRSEAKAMWSGQWEEGAASQGTTWVQVSPWYHGPTSPHPLVEAGAAWWARDPVQSQVTKGMPHSVLPINLPLKLSGLTPSSSICCCGSGCRTSMQIEIPDPQANRS